MKIAKMNLSYFLILLFVQSISFAKVEAIIGNNSLPTNSNLFIQLPKTLESEIIISREQYVLSYNKFNHSPNWVAWKLDKNSMGTSGRTNNFQTDEDLQNYLAANDSTFDVVTPEDYKGSCFDRGHQVPSADRTASVSDNSATFIMSNMAPQTAYLNRVIWEQLESYTRSLIKNQNKKVFIIAGSIYDDNFGSIGPNKNIKVPSKAYKIIFVLNSDQTAADINKNTPVIAVIMPNTLKDGSKPDFSGGCKTIEAETSQSKLAEPKVNDWEKYKTTLSEVERIAKIQFTLN